MPVKTLRRIVRHVLRGNRNHSSTAVVEPEAAILLHEIELYRDCISRHIPYYNRLTAEDQVRFIQRTYIFLKSKQFHYHVIEATAEMPILVSAAAIQISFGLRKYRLPFFKHIHIHADAYTIDEMPGLYIGHVAPRSIHISWKYFLHGYANTSDNINVAIHEMAHALHYENFIPETGVDWDFRNSFEKFQQITGPAFVEVWRGRPSYLRPYAYTNAQEFWAVSVEAFFENPTSFRKYMPGLYDMIAKVLNQNPAENG